MNARFLVSVAVTTGISLLAGCSDADSDASVLAGDEQAIEMGVPPKEDASRVEGQEPPQEPEDAGQMPELVFRVAGAEWPLVLEDGDYQRDVLIQAVKDIHRVYGPFEEYRVVDCAQRASEVVLDGQVTKITQCVDFLPSQRVRIPMLLKREFGGVVEVDGVQHVVLSRTLLDAYGSAYTLRMRWPGAFARLSTFIDRMNETPSKQVSDEELESLFCRYPRTNPLPDIGTLRDIRSQLERGWIRYPSLLDPVETDDTDLLLKAPLVEGVTNEISGTIGFAYSNERWCVVLPF